MPPKFPNPDLVACARREVAMRAKSYPKWEQKETIVDCSQKRQAEHAMMEAIAEQLEALPELLRRYEAAKAELVLAYKGSGDFYEQLQKYIAQFGPLP